MVGDVKFIRQETTIMGESELVGILLESGDPEPVGIFVKKEKLRLYKHLSDMYSAFLQRRGSMDKIPLALWDELNLKEGDEIKYYASSGLPVGFVLVNYGFSLLINQFP